MSGGHQVRSHVTECSALRNAPRMVQADKTKGPSPVVLHANIAINQNCVFLIKNCVFSGFVQIVLGL